MRLLLAGLLIICYQMLGTYGVNSVEKLAPQILQLAESDGIIRVIVEVRPSEPDANADKGMRGFCENTACAKLQVEQVLTADMASNVKEVSESMMAMDVTAEGLKVLQQMPLVERISLDGVTDPIPMDENDDSGTEEQPENNLPPDLSAPQD